MSTKDIVYENLS